MSERAQFVALRDGRRLAYSEHGPAGGVPVLAFHGGGLSRLQHYGDEAPAAAGVRLVHPDRPGFGRSDAQPGRTLLDWPEDVRELADALGVERFAVFGVSAGGPPALACGFGLPERVAAVGVVSGVGPYVDAPELTATLPPERRELVELARRDFDAAVAMIREDCEREAATLLDPEAILSAWPPGTPDSDRELMSDPAIRARFVAAFRESAERGAQGGFDETVLHYARPWGFDLRDVRVPVHVWHGDRDPFVPLAAAELVAARVPGATLAVYPGEGHTVDYRHIDTILATLAAALR